MRLSRLRALIAVVVLGIAAACAHPADREPFPPQDEEFEHYVENLTREAERQMEEMLRENEEFLSQFTEEEPLRLAPVGGR
jgi:hypothetical protein